MLAALKRGEAEDLRSLLQGAHWSGLAIETLADAVVAPAMRRLGHEWAEGRVDVWHEHRGTQLCAAALYEIRATLQGPADGTKPLAIGGGPEGDPYLLANLLAEMVLTGLGWKVVNLGPNTPLPSFRAALRKPALTCSGSRPATSSTRRRSWSNTARCTKRLRGWGPPSPSEGRP